MILFLLFPWFIFLCYLNEVCVYVCVFLTVSFVQFSLLSTCRVLSHKSFRLRRTRFFIPFCTIFLISAPTTSRVARTLPEDCSGDQHDLLWARTVQENLFSGDVQPVQRLGLRNSFVLRHHLFHPKEISGSDSSYYAVIGQSVSFSWLSWLQALSLLLATTVLRACNLCRRTADI